MMRRFIRPFFRLVAVMVVTGVGAVALICARLFSFDPAKRSRRSLRLQVWWAACIVDLLDIKISMKGAPAAPPVLLAPNHTTYLDIIVLSAVAPTVFVPKQELRNWPIAGWLMRGTEQVFVQRVRGASLRQTAERIGEVLEEGRRICLFLEGTTTGGDRLLPFRPALLEGAISRVVPVQPVALKYSVPAGLASVQEDVAYWKDHVFGPHLWNLLGIPAIDLEIVFGEPIPTEGRDRKSLARELHEAVLALRPDLTSDTEYKRLSELDNT